MSQKQPENRDSESAPPHEPKANHPAVVDELTCIQDMLRGLQFGSLQIIVQDGLIVQIERT